VSIRQRGLLYAVAGAVLTVVAFTLLRAGFNLFGVIGGLLVFAPPAMVTVGIAMVLVPGEGGGDLDLSDWLDGLPLRRRLVFYGSGALGLGIGGLLLLVLGNWSVSGVLEILF
jgi:hypothetical protein